MSPRSITRIEDSRNHGLVRGPEASRRHSIHSPPPANVAAVELGPESVFRDAGPERLAHPDDGLLTHGYGVAHQDDLAVRLDLAGVLHHFEAVVNFISEALHLNHAHRPDAINGDPRVATAPLANHRVQLGRPGSRVVSLPPAGNEIEHVGSRRGPRRLWEVPR